MQQFLYIHFVFCSFAKFIDEFSLLFYMAVLGLCCFVGFSLVVESGGYSSLQCVGFSLQWLLLLQSKDSRVLGPQ